MALLSVPRQVILGRFRQKVRGRVQRKQWMVKNAAQTKLLNILQRDKDNPKQHKPPLSLIV